MSYCAGVYWIQIECGILFEGRDGNLKELTATVWTLSGVSFLQPRRHVQNTDPRKQPSDRQHFVGRGKGWDKGKESGACG